MRDKTEQELYIAKQRDELLTIAKQISNPAEKTEFLEFIDRRISLYNRRDDLTSRYDSVVKLTYVGAALAGLSFSLAIILPALLPLSLIALSVAACIFSYIPLCMIYCERKQEELDTEDADQKAYITETLSKIKSSKTQPDSASLGQSSTLFRPQKPGFDQNGYVKPSLYPPFNPYKVS